MIFDCLAPLVAVDFLELLALVDAWLIHCPCG